MEVREIACMLFEPPAAFLDLGDAFFSAKHQGVGLPVPEFFFVVPIPLFTLDLALRTDCWKLWREIQAIYCLLGVSGA